MTMGAISVTGVLDGSGSMKVGEMEIGPITMKMERAFDLLETFQGFLIKRIDLSNPG